MTRSCWVRLVFAGLYSLYVTLWIVQPAVAAAPSPDDVKNILGSRNGFLTFSMEDAADGARAKDASGKVFDQTHSAVDRACFRKLYCRWAVPPDGKGWPGTASYLKQQKVRQYMNDWTVSSESRPEEYASLPESPEGDTQLADLRHRGMSVDFMGQFLRFSDLSKSQTQETYEAQRQAFLNYIRKHVEHRYASGLNPAVLSKKLKVDDLFDKSLQHDRNPDFIRPKSSYTGGKWTLEFLFQRKPSWPKIDEAVLKKSGSESTPRRADANGNADYLGVWLSPYPFEAPAPKGTEASLYGNPDACNSLWDKLKNATVNDPAIPGGPDKVYDSVVLQTDQFDVSKPDQYSVLWGPAHNDYYFDAGHDRTQDEMQSLTGNINDAWYQYQCQILVKAEGDIDGEHCGPYYYSDLVYVEMYIIDKQLPKKLEDARKAYGDRNDVAYAPAEDTAPEVSNEADLRGDTDKKTQGSFVYRPSVNAAGERKVTRPDVTMTMFKSFGVPDGMNTPLASYPKDDMDFKTQLPPFFAQEANVYYKTGADTRSLIRFPENEDSVPSTLPAEARTPEGFTKFLDQYYNQFAVYYPPVEVDKTMMGPWLIVLTPTSPVIENLYGDHTYAPNVVVPGTQTQNPPVRWRDAVYKPVRFDGELRKTIDFLCSHVSMVVRDRYGTDRMPSKQYPYAMKGVIWRGHPIFEIPVHKTQYVLKKGALPLPVGYETVHGAVKDPATGTEATRIAGADVLLKDPGWTQSGAITSAQLGAFPPDPFAAGTLAQDVVPHHRDNYAYSAVTISVGCCGSVTLKLIQKNIATAFQPRAGLTCTLVDSQNERGAKSQSASCETLGFWNDNSLTTGKAPLPYDPSSVSSRMAPGYKYAGYKNNFAMVSYDAAKADGLYKTAGLDKTAVPPDLLSDAQGKNPLKNQLTYYEGQSYNLEVAAEPATGPTMVGEKPDGSPSPGEKYVYYCAKELRVVVNQIAPTKKMIQEWSLIGKPLDKGPFKGLNTEPPMGTVNVVWPQAGTYEVVTKFVDCNGETREMVSRIDVARKGFDLKKVGEERERGENTKNN